MTVEIEPKLKSSMSMTRRNRWKDELKSKERLMQRVELKTSTISAMKSANRSDDKHPFWEWFAIHACDIADEPTNERLIADLDRRVSIAWPNLSWEIGPDTNGGWYFALSPNLNRDYADEATDAIAGAPAVLGWTFHPTRQRKCWDGRFELQREKGHIEIDSGAWKYILLRYPDGQHEVVLFAPEATELDENDRWNAAAIVLEGLLGEECVLRSIEKFALESSIDAKVAGREKPIHMLPKAFGLSEM